MQFNLQKIKSSPVKNHIHFSFNRIASLVLITFLLCVSVETFAQTANDSANILTLKQCIDYALKNQPALKQSIINEDITKTTNDIALSGWLPQVGVTAN